MSYICNIIANILKRYDVRYELVKSKYVHHDVYDTILAHTNDMYNHQYLIVINTNPLLTYSNLCIIYINDIRYTFNNPETLESDIENLFSFV